LGVLNRVNTKILLSVLFPSAVVLALVAITALIGYERVAEGVVRQRDTELALSYAAHLHDAMRLHAAPLRQVAGSPEIQSLDRQRVSQVLDDARGHLFAFDSGVVAYDMTRTAIGADYYADRLVGTAFPAPDDFTAVTTGTEFALSDVIKGPVSDDDVIVTVVAIPGADGDVVGALVGYSNIHTSTLANTFSDVLDLRSGASSFAYLVDSGGRIVFHRDASYRGLDLSSLPQVALAQSRGPGAVIAVDPEDNRVIAGFSPVEGTPWSVITQESWDVVAQPIHENNILLLGLLVGGSLFAGLVVFVATSLVLRPLKDLSLGAQRIASGDFDHRIEAHTDDELEQLARQFNVMAETLKASYSELEGRVVERTRELGESERRLRQVVTGAPIIMAVIDTDGTFRLVEGAILPRLGIDPATMVGRSAYEVLERHTVDFERAFRGEAFSSSLTISGVIFSTSFSPVFGDDGALESVIAVATDITDLHRAQEALAKSEEAARELAHEHAIMADIARIVGTSLEIDQVYEVFADQVKTLIPFDTISISEIDPASDTFRIEYNLGRGAGRPIGTNLPLAGSATGEVVRQGKGILLDVSDEATIDSQYPMLRPVFESGHKSYIAVPLRSKGEVTGVLHLISTQANAYDEHDLEMLERVGVQISGAVASARLYRNQLESEAALRRYAEDLRRSNADLEQFAYVASHDLQEPLRAIVGFTRMLARRYQGKLGDEADDYIARTVNAALRMQSLIADLLAYSRIGRDLAGSEPTDLNQVFDGVKDNLRASIEEKHAVVASDTLPVVPASASIMSQVLTNLVSNAIKYNESNPPIVHVSVAEQEDDWLFTVEDNGIGIEPQFQDRIFVIFQRLHGRTEYSGTGIGLAICKKAVERLGGKIWLESVPGVGTKFFFTVPRKISENTGVSTAMTA
jgi:PAS domain S-box-containing protein